MSMLLLDTNAFAWTLIQSTMLTPYARSAIAGSSVLYLSPISMFEITQKVRVGKWPAMSAAATNLAAYAYIQRLTLVPLDAAICSAAGSMGSSHKDPFDRMIAATALHLGCPVVSSDAVFDDVVPRIW